MTEVYNMDCMEYMKGLPDGHFDLCIADPPYGISVTDRHRTGEKTVLVGGGGRPFGGKAANQNARVRPPCESQFYPAFDDSSPPNEEVFRELERVSKHLIVWGGNFFIDKLKPASCMIVWDKKRRGLDQADCEIAWTNLPGQSRVFEFRWNGMLQGNMKHKEERIHACQKPVALYKYLLSTFAKPGDKIFDPYLGSGSSRIAAYDLGFDFVGTELSDVYFRLEEERFREHTQQTRMNL